MKDYSHICEFSYCKTHQVCLYKNARAVLNNNMCKAKAGSEENANILVCYEKGLDKSVYSSPFFNDKYYRNVSCENPKCKSFADTKFNGEVNLCFDCVDLLREFRTNYELGTVFRKKDKLINLLKVIDEYKNESKIGMVRCSNIYCGTIENMTRHHLVPKPFRNRQTVEKIPLCEPCHKRVHQLATNTELATYYNTKRSVVELLANDIKFRVQRMMNVCQSENLLAVA